MPAPPRAQPPPPLSAAKPIATAMPPRAVDVVFDNVSYTIPAKRRSPFHLKPDPPIPILHNVSGRVAAGEALAILGPSGSGKTTLLNLLAARSAHAPSSGSILFSGRPRIPRTKRHIGYVMQDDVFFSKLTVRTTLEFTADIRLPRTLSREQRRQRVERALSRLRLLKCQHTRIGDQIFDKGISGGERKRVNIANELLHEPGLILADECTSGLDSSSAFTVINLLRELCAEGRTVIATIHQPSSQMFSLFDKIMLLAAGRVAYFGSPLVMAEYFRSIDLPFPEHAYNPADYALELAIDDQQPEGGISVQQRIVNEWHVRGSAEGMFCPSDKGRADEGSLSHTEERGRLVTSTSHFVVVDLADEVNASPATSSCTNDDNASDDTSSRLSRTAPLPSSPPPLKEDPDAPVNQFARIRRATAKRVLDITGRHGEDDFLDKYPTSWWAQVQTLSRRAIRQKRGLLIQPTFVVQNICVIIITSLMWFQIALDETTIEDRLGALSFFGVYWAFTGIFNAIYAFPPEKQVLSKDRSSGSYRLSAYYFAKTMVEAPADALFPILFSTVVYWSIGLNPDFRAFLMFTILLILNALVATSLGLLFSAVMMNVRQAQIFGATWVLTAMTMAGYIIDPNNTPAFLRPFRFMSFIRFAYDGLVQNEMSYGRTMPCATDPSARTIYSTSGCPIKKEGLLKGAQLDTAHPIGTLILIQLAFIFIARVLGYFALKTFHTSHKPKLSTWNGSRNQHTESSAEK